jgi:nitronate monooxygenase
VVSLTFGLPPAGTVRRLHAAGSLVVATVNGPDEVRRTAL